MKINTTNMDFKSGYSLVNGLNMYYEIYGQGEPLVLIHGGGSTIQTTFQRIIPQLAKKRQIIAMDLQAHGRTDDRDINATFKQDADDVAALLINLAIAKADCLGFSNGGHTLIELALRHAHLLNKIIICSAFYKRSATLSAFWNGFDKATLNDMPQPLQDAFLKVNNNTAALLAMFESDVQKNKAFKDWTDEEMSSIQLPSLIINGTHDVGSPEHAIEMSRIIPNCELAILPSDHGEYIGEVNPETTDSVLPDITVSLVERFLDT